MAKASNEMAQLSMMTGNMSKSSGSEVVTLSERENAQRALAHNLRCYLEQTPLKMVNALPSLTKDLERMNQLAGQWAGQIEALGKMIEDTKSERENLLNRAVRESDAMRGRNAEGRRGKPRPANKNVAPKLQTGDAVALNMLLKKEFELNQKLKESQEQLEKVTHQKSMLEARLQGAETMAKTAVFGTLERIKKHYQMFKESSLLMRYVQSDLEGKVKEALAKLENTHGASASFLSAPLLSKLEQAKSTSMANLANFQQLQSHYEKLQAFMDAQVSASVNFMKVQYLISAPAMTQAEMNTMWESLFLKALVQLAERPIEAPLTPEQILPYEQTVYELKTLVAELTKV